MPKNENAPKRCSDFHDSFWFSGRCWMDALELALKCSSLLKRTMIREGKEDASAAAASGEHSINFYSLLRAHNIHGFQ